MRKTMRKGKTMSINPFKDRQLNDAAFRAHGLAQVLSYFLDRALLEGKTGVDPDALAAVADALKEDTSKIVEAAESALPVTA